MAANTLTPIPQDKIGESINWRNWFNTVQLTFNSVLGSGATGTFKSSDTPAKTITVVNGVITKIQ